MVQEVDLNDCACLFKQGSYLFICIAWLNVTRRVIMDQDDCVSTFPYCRLENLPWVDKCSIECADRNQFCFHNLVFCVQVQHKKVLLRFIRYSAFHVFNYISSGLYFFIEIPRIMQSLVQFENSNDLHSLHLPDASDLLKISLSCIGQFFKTELPDNFSTGVNNIKVS